MPRSAILCLTFFAASLAGGALPENLALGRSAGGSSVYAGNAYARGNDGNRDGGYYSGNSVFHTAAPETNVPSFWEVDLGAMFYLDHLMVWPRTDVVQGSVKDVRLRVFDSGGAEVWSRDFLSGLPADQVWGTSALRGVRGQRVRLERTSQTPAFLTFAECEISGSTDPRPDNLALDRPVTTSGGGGSGTLLNAGNDGNIDGDYGHGKGIWHSTATTAGTWWQVDLGREMALDGVLLYNRTDFANTTRVKLSVRDEAGGEVWSSLLQSSLNTLVRGGKQAEVPVDLPDGTKGRYVRLETVTAGEALSFAELEVFGPVADITPPAIVATVPADGEAQRILTEVRVTFQEEVRGVTAADLLVNGVSAAQVIALPGKEWAFRFPQPADGTVLFRWNPALEIEDLAGNAFVPEGGWTVPLDSSLPEARPVITEFLTGNEGGLRDADGDSPDWIEITNTGLVPADMGGWSLTDSPALPARWVLPPFSMAAGERRIIFASGKNRAGGELHTSFKLTSEAGGYLALADPAGVTVSEFRDYPKQRTNVSFGTARQMDGTPLLPVGAPARVHIPAAEDAGLAWTDRAFDDSTWQAAVSGIGFDSGESGGPAGFWDFNDATVPGTVPDRSGYARNAAAGGTQFTADGGGRTGLAGDRAMDFAAAGSLVSVPGAADGSMFAGAVSRDEITVSLWTRGAASRGVSAQDSVFWAAGTTDGTGVRMLNAHLPWSDQVVYFDTGGCCDSSTTRGLVYDPEPAHWRGAWNHWVFVKRGEGKEIWHNGTLTLTTRNTAALGPIRSFWLGNGSGPYQGLIDDFAVWDFALGGGQIAALAAGVSPLDITRLDPLIATDIRDAMQGRNASAWMRFPFTLTENQDLSQLLLTVNGDDGFAAWLNGYPIARRRVPSGLSWDSAAVTARLPGAALVAEEIDVSAFAAVLRGGVNVLAVQGVNASAADGDFLIRPELRGGRLTDRRFFPVPTPGAANGSGFTGFAGDTRFSPGRGFYDAPVTVTIACATPDAVIAVTTDGSEPSLTNGVQSASPATVEVSTTTCVRARAFSGDLVPSNVDTHTYLFPADVAGQSSPAGLGATWPGGEPVDFTMDSRPLTNPQGVTLTDSLRSLPALSLVLPESDLFGPGGLYANSDGRGPAWERAASAELVYPDGQPGFHESFGLRMHGNISRQKSFTPKHSFRMKFRGQYGAPVLETDLFPGEVRKFDQLVLRGGSTDTWPCLEWDPLDLDGVSGTAEYRWRRDWASYVRDQWVRDTQIAMGQPSARGRYVHLFLNGYYWGLYNLTEHPDEDFSARHFGGRSEEWDALADFTEVMAGTGEAWNELLGLAGANLSVEANYQRMLGRNADGSPNPDYPVLLNEQSLIDDMILHIFAGADDWPNHNWWATRRSPERIVDPLSGGSDGFHFFSWDQEISNVSPAYRKTAWGPLYQEVAAAGTPSWVYSRCRLNAGFRRRFGDSVQRHLFHGGALSGPANLARFAARTAEIEKALVAEAARWGDYRRVARPYRPEVEWAAEVSRMNASYWPQINAAALARFRAGNLYPSLAAPDFSLPGGDVPPGTPVTVTDSNASGTVLYVTADGTDPAAPGVSAYAGPVILTPPARLKARARRTSTGEWSALTEAVFTLDPDGDNDGLPDAWELANGLDPARPEDAASDADGDGATALEEYLFATDPRSAASRFAFRTLTPGPGSLTVSFLASADRRYTLRHSETLADWQEEVLPVESAGRVVELILPVQSGRVFVELKAEIP